MNNDRKLYRRLLDTEWNMACANMDDLITWDEYSEFNNMASAIEIIFDNKYGEREIKKWRHND